MASLISELSLGCLKPLTWAAEEFFRDPWGVSGRLGAALAILGFFSFFCFFFLPTIGAISSCSVGFTSASCTVASFEASLRCLRCWLFVVARTDADPTFDGGGELVRDAEIDALTTDALSDIISLAGVAGR